MAPNTSPACAPCDPDAQAAPSARAGVLVVAVMWAVLFAVRVSAPADLAEIGFERTIAYVQDIVQNGNWICQHDSEGNITSKPPLHAWLLAIPTLPFGYVNHFTICLLAGLSTLLVAVMILLVGRTYFGPRAGLLGAAAYLLSPVGVDQMVFIRTDALFVLTVTATALAAFRAWKLGRGWTWFWLAAAATTLTKGPLGVLFAGIGLLAAVWEMRGGKPAPVRGRQGVGIALFLLVTLGWFGLAYLREGWPLVNKMIGRELLGEGVAGVGHIVPGQRFHLPFLYFLSRFAPWSLLTCVGFWRILRHPSSDDWQRRFERFLFCWFFVPLILFSLAIHQAPRHVFPILPAAALLAGREMARLLAAARPKTLVAACAAGTVIALTLVVFVDYIEMSRNWHVTQSQSIKELADSLREKVGDGFPFIYADTCLALQYQLKTYRRATPIAQAVKLLQGDAPVFVVVCRLGTLETQLPPNGQKLYHVVDWPASGQLCFHIVGNRPFLARTVPLPDRR